MLYVDTPKRIVVTFKDLEIIQIFDIMYHLISGEIGTT